MVKISSSLSKIFLRKKYYKLHYKMWNYIVDRLTVASKEDLANDNFVSNLIYEYTKGTYIYNRCYLCHICFFRSSEGCKPCPLYNSTDLKCTDAESAFSIVTDIKIAKAKRIEVAKKIRDCVLTVRRKR